MKELKYGVPRYLPDGSINPEWCRRVYAALTPEQRKQRNDKHNEWQRRNRAKMMEYRKRYYEKNPNAEKKVKEANKLWRRKWREANPEKAWRIQWMSKLKCTYGINAEKYLEMLKEQKRECVLCGRKHVDKPRKRLTVDHDHVSGKVRALLCGDCNNMIGRAKDNPVLLEKAAAFIRSHRD